jgi:hypothetical protein
MFEVLKKLVVTAELRASLPQDVIELLAFIKKRTD